MRVELGPSPLTAALPVLVALVLALAAFTVDVGGQLLVLPAAGLLLALGLRDLVLRPTLALAPDGLEVVVGWRRRAAHWRELERARVVTDRRTPLLELDLGDTVVVLSRRRLGVPPYQALATLEEVRPT